MIESNASTISSVLVQVPARVMENTASTDNSNVGIIVDALGSFDGTTEDDVEGLAL